MLASLFSHNHGGKIKPMAFEFLLIPGTFYLSLSLCLTWANQKKMILWLAMTQWQTAIHILILSIKPRHNISYFLIMNIIQTKQSIRKKHWTPSSVLLQGLPAWLAVLSCGSNVPLPNLTLFKKKEQVICNSICLFNVSLKRVWHWHHCCFQCISVQNLPALLP